MRLDSRSLWSAMKEGLSVEEWMLPRRGNRSGCETGCCFRKKSVSPLPAEPARFVVAEWPLFYVVKNALRVPGGTTIKM